MAYPINVQSLIAGIKADLKETWRNVVPTWEKGQAIAIPAATRIDLP